MCAANVLCLAFIVALLIYQACMTISDFCSMDRWELAYTKHGFLAQRPLSCTPHAKTLAHKRNMTSVDSRLCPRSDASLWCVSIHRSVRFFAAPA